MNRGTRVALGKVSKVAVALTILFGGTGSYTSGAGAAGSRTFPETNKTVSGIFLDYWNNHGGLAQQGFPISDEVQEKSNIDGKTYTVQYFERAVFEKHPENVAPYDVLLSLLGSTLYSSKYNGNAPGQQASNTRARTFPETGKTIGGVFRTYWEQNGGLAQQGYPISNEFKEKSATDGKTYTVQYFERAVFELHPENAGKPSEVLLSLLGTFRLGAKGGGGTPSLSASFAAPGWTSIAISTNNFVLFYNAASGNAEIAKLGADGSLTTRLRFPDPAAGAEPFAPGFTLIVTLPDSRWLAYNKTTGAAIIVTISDEAELSEGDSAELAPGWSYMAFDTQTRRGVFYNDATLARATVYNPAGGNEIITLKYFEGLNRPVAPTDFRWSQFVPLGSGFWFWYGNNTVDIEASIVRIDSDGTAPTVKKFTNFDVDWTHIVGAGAEAGGLKLVLYKKSKGILNTAIVSTATGDYAGKFAYSGLSAAWTIVAGVQNGIVLFYDEKGNIATDLVDRGGAETALKRYSPK
ncbi:MAG: hypothetical protein ABI670_21650 [Chloroflexota bacterium]